MSGTKSTIVCLYAYDAWGNCKVLDADGTPNEASTFIGNISPFRWKSRYYDSETGWIYNEGRYYDPAIGQYIDADAPENLLLNSAVINGLNRYGITTDNAVALVGALYNIFTATKLYTDPDYKAGFDWRIVIDIVIIAALIILSFAANPVGFLAANLVAMGFAISGAIIGGIVSWAIGNDIWDGAAKGARIGYAVGMLVYSVVSITMAVRATVNAPDAAKVAESTKPSNTVATETAAAQPAPEKNILENIEYTDRVKGKMAQDIRHGFPRMIDDIAGAHGKVGPITGGDGIVRTAVELPGAINGQVGWYQYIIEPNGITVNHRYFDVISLLGG